MNENTLASILYIPPTQHWAKSKHSTLEECELRLKQTGYNK